VTANLFDGPPDFEHDGMTMRGVAKAAGSELLGATAYELAPGHVVAFLRGRRGAHRLSNESGTPTRFVLVSTMAMPEVVEYPESERVFVMSEPPWSGAPYDETRGRVIRGFAKRDGRAVPPDSDD